MQYTLYIRKGIDEQFSAEEDKSKLVNELLQAHYGGETVQSVTLPRAVSPPAKSTTHTETEGLPSIRGNNLCKVHNLPLTIYGKCLQKGCKYA